MNVPSQNALYRSAITGIVIRVTNVYDDPAISETVYVGVDLVAPLESGWRLAPVISLQQLNEWFVAVPVLAEAA